jgi:GTPase Era involved in 16S rRNA processing
MDTSENITTANNTETGVSTAVDTPSLTSSMLWLFDEMIPKASAAASVTEANLTTLNIDSDNSTDEQQKQQQKMDATEEVIMVALLLLYNNYNFK